MSTAALHIDANIQDFRQRINDSASKLNQMHDKNVRPARIVQFRVNSVDSILEEAWNEMMQQPACNQDMALVAVGGYGREELNPYSDIDILILVDDGVQDKYAPMIEQFVRFLWDIGYEIGHSIRTLGDCVKQSRNDITVMTNLLEARYCAGSKELFSQLKPTLEKSKVWPVRKFYQAKLDELETRHHKFADTAFNLEPNVKEGPGGLRDIHTIMWIAMRYFGGRDLHGLVEHGFLLEEEYQSLIRGRNYLWKMRNALHIVAGRREDRLLFAHQVKLAKVFGCFDDDSNKAVEKLMKPYFRTVKELRHITSMLQQHLYETIFAPKRLKIKAINERFRLVDGYLDFADPAQIDQFPQILVEACTLFQNNEKIRGVRSSTLRLMRSKRRLINRQLRLRQDVQASLISIFRKEQRLTETLKLMDDTNLLGRLIPQFKQITGQLQYDLFHVYTVDAHLLNVIWHLHQLTRPETSQELPAAWEAMKRLVKPERLFLAGLFHDIAKGQGGDHSQLGEVQSYKFCKDAKMSEYDAHFVAWLVRHHLAMSFTSQREDLNDPEVISRFATKVGNQEHLDNLYLLTIADMRGTGPAVWNDWKGKMLEHLFLATSRALLTNTLPHDEVMPRIQEVQLDSLAQLNKQPRLKTSAQRIWELLDDDYFLSYDANTIAWHVEQLSNASAIEFPLVAFRTHPSIEVVQVLVFATSSDELFTIVAGALDRQHLNVVEARMHPLPNGLTAYTFVVLTPDSYTSQSERYLRSSEDEVYHSIIKRKIEHSPRSVAPHRVAQHMQFPTRAVFSHSSGSDYTMMEISARDRPGLLYLVVRTLLKHRIKLLSAKITTSGVRVRDVFFIVDRDGNYLADKKTQSVLADDIRQAVDSVTHSASRRSTQLKEHS